jgi:replicative DNA helicase
MRNTTLEVVDDIRNHNDIITYTKYKIHKGECDVIVIDYMQNLSDNGYRDNFSMLKDASYQLQALAIKHDVAVIALSQLNEDGSFKGAKNMYAASDVSLVIERERDEFGELKKESQLIVTKNRHGRVGRVDIVFNEACNKVNELYNHYK